MRFVLAVVVQMLIASVAPLAHGAVIRTGIDYAFGNPIGPDGTVRISVAYIPDLTILDPLRSFSLDVSWSNLTLVSFRAGGLAPSGDDPVIVTPASISELNQFDRGTFARGTQGDISNQFPPGGNRFVSLLDLVFTDVRVGFSSYNIGSGSFLVGRFDGVIDYSVDIAPIRPQPSNGAPEPPTLLLLAIATLGIVLLHCRRGACRLEGAA